MRPAPFPLIRCGRFSNRPYGVFIRRNEDAVRTTTGGCPYDPIHAIAGPANGAQECAPYETVAALAFVGDAFMRPAPFSINGDAGGSRTAPTGWVVYG